MTHLQEELTAYLAGELDGVERERADAHLKTCPECRSTLEKLKDVDGWLDHAAPIEPSAGFAKRVITAVDQEKHVIAFRTRKIISWIALAAAIVFFLLLMTLRHEIPGPQPVVNNPPRLKPAVSPNPEPPEVAEKIPEQPKPVVAQTAHPEIAVEDAELIAHLDELENWDVISNYDSLQEMDTALVAPEESLQ